MTIPFRIRIIAAVPIEMDPDSGSNHHSDPVPAGKIIGIRAKTEGLLYCVKFVYCVLYTNFLQCNLVNRKRNIGCHCISLSFCYCLSKKSFPFQYTMLSYQDSKVENSMEVAIPPKILPTKSTVKLEDSLVRQQNV